MTDYCVRYCGVACVNGSCPNAIEDEFRQGKISCEECWHYEGCKDCCFEGTELCMNTDTGYDTRKIKELKGDG